MKVQPLNSDPALLKRVLPALRMMVRCPMKPNQQVSFETKIELTDIEAWTTTRGRPTAALLERLERQVEQPDSARNPAPTMVAPALAGARPLWLQRERFRQQVFKGWLPELDALAAGTNLAAACQATGSEASGLRQYLRKWVGISWTPEIVRQFVGWGRAKAGLTAPSVPPAQPSRLPAATPTSARSQGDSTEDSAALVELIALRDRYVAELDRLNKTLGGINRAIVVMRAKIEVSTEILSATRRSAA